MKVPDGDDLVRREDGEVEREGRFERDRVRVGGGGEGGEEVEEREGDEGGEESWERGGSHGVRVGKEGREPGVELRERSSSREVCCCFVPGLFSFTRCFTRVRFRI